MTYTTPMDVAQPFDINIDPASFPKIASLLGDNADICHIPAQIRKSDTYLLNHPDYIKRVLIDNHKNYVKGVGFERVKLLLGNGIIVSDGEFWKQQRRMVQPGFHRDMLKALTVMMAQVSQNVLADWQYAAEQNKAINISEAMSSFALEVILRGIFSDDVDWMNHQSGSNPFAIFTENASRDLNLARKFRDLTKLMQSVIDRRREQTLERVDILAALMEARDLQKQPMQDKALIDELMTLIVAGHETSATTLTWMWYLIAQNPKVEGLLHQEVDALSIAEGSIPDYETLISLAYCKQIMHETLRLYPPVWLFSRKAIDDDIINKQAIPAGSDIFISPYFLHRRADLWPEPNIFDPSRFSAEHSQNRNRLSFIPFSAGPRKCIGDIFSTVEIQIHMCIIARKLRLESDPEQIIELEPAINLRNKHPIVMMPKFR